MDSFHNVMQQRIDEVNKRKVTKRKDRSQKAIAYRTIGRVSQAEGNNQEGYAMTKGQKVEQELDDLHKSIGARKNAEIDRLIHSLIIDGVVDKAYSKWVAGAIHKLGMQQVVELVNQSRDGKTPQKLFAYKLKGALEIYNNEQALESRAY